MVWGAGSRWRLWRRRRCWRSAWRCQSCGCLTGTCRTRTWSSSGTSSQPTTGNCRSQGNFGQYSQNSLCQFYFWPEIYIIQDSLRRRRFKWVTWKYWLSQSWMKKAREPGSRAPNGQTRNYITILQQNLAAAKLYNDFVTEISQQPRYSEWGSQRPQGFFFMHGASRPTRQAVLQKRQFSSLA